MEEKTMELKKESVKLAVESQKHKFYTELAYLFGIIGIALGTALLALAEFGVALPVVSAHVIHHLLHHYEWVTLGMVEIACQAVLFVVLAIICREVKKAFLLSMVSGVIYSAFLDLFLIVLGLLPQTLTVRIAFFVVGFFIFALGEILLHYTYVQSEFYEFFCHELSHRFKWKFYKVKLTFEITLCLIGVVLSFAFNGIGEVHGLGIGTLICALLIIKTSNLFGKLLNKHYVFCDKFNKRKFFQE